MVKNTSDAVETSAFGPDQDLEVMLHQGSTFSFICGSHLGPKYEYILSPYRKVGARES